MLKNVRKIYQCGKCGNLVDLMENTGITVTCCGEPMTELIPNTVDASKEKHVPSVAADGNKLKVVVGEVPHPMTKEHHITWIIVAEGNRTTRVVLPETGPPEEEFYIGAGPITVYAFCNLHGLWAVDL